MKNKFDNKAELVFAKDQSGAFSLAIDFGEKLLQQNENYAVQLSIPPDVVRQTVGQAVASDILVIQLGFDQIFIDQVARRDRLDIGLDGYLLAFSLNGTGKATENLLNCAVGLNQKDGTSNEKAQENAKNQSPQEIDPALEIKKLREENERLKAEQELKIQKEAERLAAEKAKAEAERIAAEEKARAEAERLAAEERARAEAERLALEEKAKAEAERLALEQKAKAEAERLAAEERARAEAERLAAEERARAEAERLAAEEWARAEAERLAAEERARAEAERLAAEERARAEAARLAAEEKAKEQARKAALAVPLLSATHTDFLRLIGINAKLEAQKVQDNYFIYTWTQTTANNVKLAAAAHFMPRPFDRSFLNLTDAYQQSIKARCAGDFAFNKADLKLQGDYVYQLAETACVAHNFKLGAALTIVADNNHFIVITYETKVDNMIDAFAERDQLLPKIENYLRQYPRFIFAGSSS
jgi:hypothetical protein